MERVKNLSCSNKKNFIDKINFRNFLAESVKPCQLLKWWDVRLIFCEGNDVIDLKSIFHNIPKQLSDNEKHFDVFELIDNKIVEVIEDNSFNDITFDVIRVMNCINLKNIERYAFNGTEMVTKSLTISNNYELSMDNKMFEILSSFVNLESIELYELEFKEIPSNAFRPINGYQNNLTKIEIGNFLKSVPGPSKIGSHAFSNLKNLGYLTLDIEDLVSISDYAFEFEEYSDQIFQIQVLS